jgi:hypothetical protein
MLRPGGKADDGGAETALPERVGVGHAGEHNGPGAVWPSRSDLSQCAAAPILETADIPGSQGIHTIASLRLDDGTIALIVESLGDKHSDLWLATMAIAH